MLIATEGIAIPIEIIFLLLSIILVCFILILINYRFSNYKKKIQFPMHLAGSGEVVGPKEWEKQMLDLASEHRNVKLMRYSFVLDDYNQAAYKKLNKIRDNISKISTDIISLIPAARWLFDNYQMMYREIKKVRTSGTSYSIIPLLWDKEYRGFPRIYVLAKKMVALSGGHINEENISIMLKAYQKEIPLTDKEIWALPEMLGFCLLESIIEMAEDIIRIINIKSKAEQFVREKLEENQSFHLDEFLKASDAAGNRDFSFHSHVIYLLKSMSFDDVTIQKYMEYHFRSNTSQLKPSTIFLEEGKIEAFLETNIRALITSLREINEIDEEQFFDEYSFLEHILSKDPAGVYSKMDSESRGMYRGVIVKLSMRYRVEEEKIANDCLKLAEEGNEELPYSHHVGTYLIGKGYPILKAIVRSKPMPGNLRRPRNVMGILYFTVLLLFLLTLIGIAYSIYGVRTTPYAVCINILILLAGLPLLTGIAMEITNFIFTRRIVVKKIPSLDYLKEIPDHARTFIVMPVIVSNANQGLEYYNRLQKHYLANRQRNLYFALLLDYADSSELERPEDKLIEKALVERVNELNDLYPSEPKRFALFIRHRKWNPSENCYMGWERKRGKLEEFNNLLNGMKKEKTSFSTILCDEKLLRTFRYVITLDADTNLIRDNASKLVGLIDHPLNHPVLDPDSKKLKEGYVIIQPSVRNHIVGKTGSRFAEIFGGQSGLAHYSTVISDIYQDIFNEGIYIGKGIYDIKAFHTLLHNAIPQNRVLSHDLLESCYARTAFSSYANVMDTFPSSVISFAKREHRWIRGDWQLFPWLFHGKDSEGRVLSALSRWKIFDNLRRSMVPLSKILFILINLVILPNAFYLWIPFIFFSDIFNTLVFLIAIMIQKLVRPKLALVYRDIGKELRAMIQRAFIEFIITPYRAYIAIDAMVRTLYRLYISKKNLLRWNTAEMVDSSISNTKKGYFITMWSSLIPPILLLAICCFVNLNTMGIIITILISFLWLFAYYFAFQISQPKEENERRASLEERELLLDTAYRTWKFFNEFSTKENNWLCPDNYQMSLVERVSYKTSPTNMGLQFLSILSARDFGFLTVSSCVALTENLMDTVQKLPKWKGHLYNWYHIKSLEVLNPSYISTVDSGNFFGHVLTLKNGLIDLLDQPIYTDNMISELNRKIRVYNGEIQKAEMQKQVMLRELKGQYDTIGDLIKDISESYEMLKREEDATHKNEKQDLLQSMEELLEEAKNFSMDGIKFRDYPTLRSAKENKIANSLMTRIQELCLKIDCMLANVDFRFLFNEKRMMFHIGYHVSSNVMDTGCYDLMASESALTSFLAVAKGEVPVRHWQKLGRPLTMIKGIPCFVSWSGTMFEYLMPNLVMKEYEGSVYADTARAAVLQQMNYAKEVDIPWGISESQYYRFDLNANYQYKAFGVPKLRLQPVRRNSLVVTPYATMLALDYASRECYSNLKTLSSLGMYGEYGFYEAIDYNHPDSVEMTPYCIVKSYMAHHQGMILVSINNYLNQGIMRRRFHSEAIIKAAEVLLEEKRHSYLVSLAKRGYTIKIGRILFKEEEYSNRYINGVAPKIPVVNYLSNNQYSMMITSDGDGFSIYKKWMLYRWRADQYANTGNYIYIKDKNQNRVWSTTYHPTRTEPKEYHVVFSPHKAEFKRVDGDVSTHTTVSLSPDHNMEIRKVTLTNNGNETKEFEVTSYLEVVCDTHLAEISHPAFNKLFIESEYLEEHSIFLSKRRGSKGIGSPYIMHMVKSNRKPTRKLEYENDRFKFIGRNHSPEDPQVVMDSISLSNQAGFCNDPIMSIRMHASLKPGEAASIAFITGVCNNREEAIQIGEELSMEYRIDDLIEKFRLQTDIELKYLEISRPQLNAFQDLISPLFYPSRYYRGPQENIRRNSKNQSFLWRFGVSGDNPIMLLKVESLEDAGVIKDVLKAFEYMKINQLAVDLIILSDAKHGYMQELDNLVNDLTSSLRIYNANNEKPSLFMLHSYDMIPAEIDLLFTVARIVFTRKTGIFFRNQKDKMNLLVEDWKA